MRNGKLEKTLNLHYAAMQATFWMYFGALVGFASVFLLARGFNNSTIGFILAISNVLAVVLQLLVANLIDRSKRVTLFGAMGSMTGMLLLIVASLYVIRRASVAITVLYVLGLSILMILQPMVNSTKRELENTGSMINFGFARGMGSLFYSILTSIIGTAVERRGENAIPVIAAMVIGIFLINLIFTSKAHRAGMAERTAAPGAAAAVGPAEKAEPAISMREFVSRHKMFMIFCAATCLIYFSNYVINMYMAQIAANVGGTSEDVGRIFSLLGIMEVPTMVLYSRISKRFRYTTLIKVSAIAFSCWIGIVALGNSVFMLFFAQIVQPFALALFQPSLVTLIDKSMAKGEAVRGQTMYTVATTASAAITGLAGGVVLDLFGAKVLTAAGFILTAAGAALAISIVDRVGRESAGQPLQVKKTS